MPHISPRVLTPLEVLHNLDEAFDLGYLRLQRKSVGVPAEVFMDESGTLDWLLKQAKHGLVSRSLNVYAVESAEANRKWDYNPATGAALAVNVGEKLMLIVSEISEAMEGHRKSLMDDKLPNRTSFEVELADALIRIFHLAGYFNLDLEGAYREKSAYNKTRLDHTHAERVKPGGKAY